MRFSPESSRNVNKRSKNFTFKGIDGNQHVVSGHAKLRQKREYRMHYDWPYKPNKKKKLEIYYLGPKTTKD